MRLSIPILLALTGVIHIAAIVGVLGSDWLSSLYGINIDDPNLMVLMRHRALLFGIIGGVLLYSAFQPVFYSLAIVLGLLSVISFIALVSTTAGTNSQLTTVVAIDLFALLCLLAAATLSWLRCRSVSLSV